MTDIYEPKMNKELLAKRASTHQIDFRSQAQMDKVLEWFWYYYNPEVDKVEESHL